MTWETHRDHALGHLEQAAILMEGPSVANLHQAARLVGRARARHRLACDVAIVAGFRPASHLCRHLSRSLRRALGLERARLAATKAARQAELGPVLVAEQIWPVVAV